MNSILVLKGTNSKEWKKKTKIVLGCIDLNLALRIMRNPFFLWALVTLKRGEIVRNGITKIA